MPCPQMSAKVPMSSVKCWQKIAVKLASVCQPLPEKPLRRSRRCPGQRLSSTPRRTGTLQQVQAYCTAGTTKATQFRFTLNVLNINSLEHRLGDIPEQ